MPITEDMKETARISAKHMNAVTLSNYESLAKKEQFDKIPLIIREFYSSGDYNFRGTPKQSITYDDVKNFAFNSDYQAKLEFLSKHPQLSKKSGIGVGGWIIIVALGLFVIQCASIL